MTPEVGTWYAFIAEKGLNQTVLGIAFYNADGNLAGSRFAGINEAIRRGDLPDAELTRYIELNPPETKAGMERRLETMANAMSMAKWIGGLPTLAWEESDIERTYQYALGGPP